jgi:hypothetical protein
MRQNLAFRETSYTLFENLSISFSALYAHATNASRSERSRRSSQLRVEFDIGRGKFD